MPSCAGCFGHTRSSVVPDDFIHEVARSKHGIHEQLQVVARGRVAMQVNATRRFQKSLHLQQPDCHHDEVGLHPLAVRLPCSVYHPVK